MPIYYVIAEMIPYQYQIPVWRIIKVIECDIEDFRTLYDKEVTPLLGAGRNIQAMFFYREPANPFDEQAERPGAAGPGGER